MKRKIFILIAILSVCTSSFGNRSREITDIKEKCFNNDKTACVYLGDTYHYGLIGEISDFEARKYYKEGCYLNDGEACNKLGFLYEKGLGGILSYTEAKEYYEKGCQLKNAKACNQLGSLYFHGRGVGVSYSKARAYFEKGCLLKNGAACGNLGSFYANGYGVNRSYEKAGSYFEKGCKLDDGEACSNLGSLYEEGFGVKKSFSEAKKYYVLGCQAYDYLACYRLARLFEKGEGVKQSYSEAQALYLTACNAGEGKSCIRLGQMYANGEGKEKSYSYAREYYGMACTAGVQEGCELYNTVVNSNDDKTNEKVILDFVRLGLTTPLQVENKLVSLGCEYIRHKNSISTERCFPKLPGNPKVSFNNLQGSNIDSVTLTYRKLPAQDVFNQYVDVIKKTYGQPTNYTKSFTDNKLFSWTNSIFIEVRESKKDKEGRVLYGTNKVKKFMEEQDKARKKKALELMWVPYRPRL